MISKFSKLHRFLLLAGLIASPLAAQTLDYTFTYNVSQWNQVVGFQTGDSLTIDFKAGTNLYDITADDIYSFKYNLAEGATPTLYQGAGWSSDVGNVGAAFSYNGTDLTITYNDNGGNYIQQNTGNNFGQIVADQGYQASTSLIGQADGFDAYLYLYSGSLQVVGTPDNASVPDGGSTVLYVGIAICGFFAVRRKRSLA